MGGPAHIMTCPLKQRFYAIEECAMNLKAAVSAINQKGILLVFPMDNRKEPPSVWSHFFPRTPMKWEWDDSGDNRVAKLWHLREELSRSGQVIYTKWFRGRATLFSRPVFVSTLRILNPPGSSLETGLGRDALQLLRILENDSPLSTKALKELAGLQGRYNEPSYSRALKELWSRLLVVVYGEVDDGAFPSIAIGATRLIFEELWNEAREMSLDEAEAELDKRLVSASLFRKHLDRLRQGPRGRPARLDLV
jgi:hypothetical protein